MPCDGLRLRKPPVIVHQIARDSAKGEECTLAIAGECLGTPETTVLAHLPSEWKGCANKSPDIGAAVYACQRCHDIMDGRIWSEEWEVFRPGDEQKRLTYMLRALQRTIVRMIEKGVIKI